MNCSNNRLYLFKRIIKKDHKNITQLQDLHIDRIQTNIKLFKLTLEGNCHNAEKQGKVGNRHLSPSAQNLSDKVFGECQIQFFCCQYLFYKDVYLRFKPNNGKLYRTIRSLLLKFKWKFKKIRYTKYITRSALTDNTTYDFQLT